MKHQKRQTWFFLAGVFGLASLSVSFNFQSSQDAWLARSNRALEAFPQNSVALLSEGQMSLASTSKPSPDEAKASRQSIRPESLSTRTSRNAKFETQSLGKNTIGTGTQAGACRNCTEGNSGAAAQARELGEKVGEAARQVRQNERARNDRDDRASKDDDETQDQRDQRRRDDWRRYYTDLRDECPRIRIRDHDDAMDSLTCNTEVFTELIERCETLKQEARDARVAEREAREDQRILRSSRSIRGRRSIQDRERDAVLTARQNREGRRARTDGGSVRGPVIEEERLCTATADRVFAEVMRSLIAATSVTANTLTIDGRESLTEAREIRDQLIGDLGNYPEMGPRYLRRLTELTGRVIGNNARELERLCPVLNPGRCDAATAQYWRNSYLTAEMQCLNGTDCSHFARSTQEMVRNLLLNSHSSDVAERQRTHQFLASLPQYSQVFFDLMRNPDLANSSLLTPGINDIGAIATRGIPGLGGDVLAGDRGVRGAGVASLPAATNVPAGAAGGQVLSPSSLNPADVNLRPAVATTPQGRDRRSDRLVVPATTANPGGFPLPPRASGRTAGPRQ